MPISASMIKTQGGMITIEATGGRRFECDGEPWKDSTDSFYIADVEIGNGNGSWHPSDDPEDIPAPSSEEREALDAQVAALSSEIPALMGEWVHLMIENGDGENSRSTVEAIVEAQALDAAQIGLPESVRAPYPNRQSSAGIYYRQHSLVAKPAPWVRTN